MASRVRESELRDGNGQRATRGRARHRPAFATGVLRGADRLGPRRHQRPALVHEVAPRVGALDPDHRRALTTRIAPAIGDAAVGAALMRALEPVGIETALAALTARERNDEAAIRLAQSALAQARYQAEWVEAQFDAVEPANQDVFRKLARKWEACLSRVRDCETRLQALEASRDRRRELTPEQRDAYLALARTCNGSGVMRARRRNCASVSFGQCWWRSSRRSRAARFTCCCTGRAATTRIRWCPATAPASTGGPPMLRRER